MNDLASLNKDERDVLETMAALYFPVHRTHLAEVLNGLNFKTQARRPFTTTKLAELLDPLVKRGFVACERDAYQCAPAHRDVLTVAAGDSGVLEDLLLNLPLFHNLSFSKWDGG